VSGANGGGSLGLDHLADLGVVVTGRLAGFAGRHALFAGDLDAEVGDAERRLRRLLAKIDAHIERTGAAAEAPDELLPLQLTPAPTELDLGDIGTILWATGFRRSYPWLDVPVLDTAGELIHDAGVTAAPGLYALGLRFQRRRNSHFLGGVGKDAARIAATIMSGPRAAPLPLAA
jgi:putative flavoprotein involved in K+ transport